MKVFQALLSITVTISCLFAGTEAKKKDDDTTAQAIRDMQAGMAGLKEASGNPAMLAQLMRDLQDPQLMAEAKKMMDNPAFQKQIKEMGNDKAFQESIKKSVEMMNDPAQAAAMEAKMEHMMKVGNNALKQQAGSLMSEAMNAMNNPEVMAEVAKMVKDPNFQQQLADMAKDPQFQSYLEAMKDMANDPEKKRVLYKWEEALGIVIKEGYGQTETTLLCATFKKMNKWVKPGSMGKPAPGYDVRIVNNMGKEVARGEQGNIGIKVKPDWPPGLFRGYLDDRKDMASVFVGDYYLTGDRATQDEDGYLWFESRNDDLIISSGYRIGPFEVESALLEHPAVQESAVVASPDADRGQVVKAFVVLAPSFADHRGNSGAEAKLVLDLQTQVKNTTAPYKYPRKIEFVTSLPKTVSGKIRRTELRDREKRNDRS